MNGKPTVTYHMSVYTKNANNAGTDANVFVRLVGTIAESGVIALKSSKTHKDKFESGHVDKFDITMADIGEITNLTVWHDSAGFSPDWLLDRIEIESNYHGRTWTLPCGQWLANNKGDRKTERELYVDQSLTRERQKFVHFYVTTYTSDIDGAGSRARVYMALINIHGQSTKLHRLEPNKVSDMRTALQRGEKYTFSVEMEDIGDEIASLRIGIDNKGRSPCWHLEKVILVRRGASARSSISYTFECNQWFSKSRHRNPDQQLIRELPLTNRTNMAEKNRIELLTNVAAQDDDCECENDNEDEDASSIDDVDSPEGVHSRHARLKKYKLATETSSEYGSETDSAVYITIYGDKNDSGELMLTKSETYEDAFECGHIDNFTIETVDLGNLVMIRIRTDGTGADAAWKLNSITITDLDKSDIYRFHYNDWLDLTNGFMANLICKPITTSAAPMLHSRRRSTDELTKYFIGLLIAKQDMIVIADDESNAEDNESEKEKNEENTLLKPKTEEPEKEQEDEANTAAEKDEGDPCFRYNLWIRFDTEKGLTQPLYLKMPRSQLVVKNTPFGPRIVSEKPRHVPFTFLEKNIGRVKKIYLAGVKDEDDNQLLESNRHYSLSWFCNRITLIDTKNATRVMAKVERKIPIVMDVLQAQRFAQSFPTRSLDEELAERLELLKKTSVRYEVTAYTADEMFAGTDSNVFIVMRGQMGTTPELKLDTPIDGKNYDRLERNTADTFVVGCMELGTITQLVVWHDGNGLCSSWKLDKIEVVSCKSKQKFIFLCKKWIPGGEKLTLDAVKQDEMALQMRMRRARRN